MKRFFLFIFVMMMFNHFSHAEVVSENQAKCLVLYYSYSGVTKTLAENIAENCGGTLLEVVDHGNYPRPESQTTYTYANNERSQIDNGIRIQKHLFNGFRCHVSTVLTDSRNHIGSDPPLKLFRCRKLTG